MTSEEKLRELIRKIIEEELKGLQEISTSAGAGPYILETHIDWCGSRESRL